MANNLPLVEINYFFYDIMAKRCTIIDKATEKIVRARENTNYDRELETTIAVEATTSEQPLPGGDFEVDPLVRDILSLDDNSNLVQDFLCQIQKQEGKGGIIDYIKSVFPLAFDKESFDPYESLNHFLSKLPLENQKKGSDILTYFLEEAPTSEHQAYCLTNIVLSAAKNPGAYADLEDKLRDIISEFKNLLNEELNDFFILRDNQFDVRQYLKEHLRFTPITETEPLITSDIEQVSPIINSILRKAYTDLAEPDKESLISYLIRDFNILIKDPTLEFILSKSPLAHAIYIFEAIGGGGYDKSDIKKLPCIFISGAGEYIKGQALNLPTFLVHEFTHLFLDWKFDNGSKPFYSNDEKGKAYWENIKALVFHPIKALADNDPDLIKLTTSVSNGYDELALTIKYKDDEIIEQLPAFAVQNIAIRNLFPDIPRVPIISQIDIASFFKAIQDPSFGYELNDNLTLSGEQQDEVF